MDSLVQYVEEPRFNSTNFEGYFKNPNLKNVRKYTYIEGGHSLLEEKPEELAEIIQNFINDV